MVHTAFVLGPLSALANTLGQLCGVGGRPFLQILFQAVFKNSLRTSSEVIATALLVNTIAFSLGVPGYNALGLYDSSLVLQLATVSVPAAVLGASAGAYVPDRGLRLVYSLLAAATSGALLARASRLAPLSNIADHSRVHKNTTTGTPLLASVPKSPPIPLPATTTAPTEASLPVPGESFCREGNYIHTDEVEHINMLDESDADDESYGETHRFVLYRPISTDNPGHSHSGEDDSDNDQVSEAKESGCMLLKPYKLLKNISSCSFASLPRNRRPKPQEEDPLTRMLQASRMSLSSLTSSAQSLITMSASTSVLPRNSQSTGSSPSYGSTNDGSPVQWQLLDLALARYTRPTLTSTSKGALFFGGLLCGALGVGVAESVLLTLIGMHDVPLAAAATSSLSVAFYAQMTASVMDGVASAGDMTKPRIAESVPWGLVAAIVPGVVVGALIGPRIHAFVPERRMLHIAAGTFAAVAISVAIVGHLGE